MKKQLKASSCIESVYQERIPFLIALTIILLSRTGHAQTAYISNSYDNTISVIDVASNTVNATIPLTSGAWGVSVNSDGSKVYVTNPDYSEVNVINTATNTVTATIHHPLFVADHPKILLVSPDGSKVYVPLYYSNEVLVINTTTNAVSDTIAVANPSDVCVSPDGSKLYVPDLSSGTVSVISTSSNDIIDTITDLPFPSRVAVSPDGSLLFVANANNSISIINTSTDIILSTTSMGESLNPGPQSISVTPDGSKLYLTHIGSENVTAFNISTLAVDTIVMGNGAGGTSVSPDGSKVYVVMYDESSVFVIDTASNTVSDTIEVGLLPIAFGNFISTYPFTGISSNEKGSLSIYPNPTPSILNIEFSSTSNKAEIGLLNVLGEKIVIQEISADKPTFKKQLDLSDYPNGTYFLSVQTDKENTVQRIVKQD